MVEGGGFEPPKLSRQIYSLIPLATREPLRKAAYCPDAPTPCQPLLPIKLLTYAHFLISSTSRLASTLSSWKTGPTQGFQEGIHKGESGVEWSWREESNPRPADYKSAALPTELRQPNPDHRAGIYRRKNASFTLLTQRRAILCEGFGGCNRTARNYLSKATRRPA